MGVRGAICGSITLNKLLTNGQERIAPKLSAVHEPRIGNTDVARQPVVGALRCRDKVLRGRARRSNAAPPMVMEKLVVGAVGQFVHTVSQTYPENIMEVFSGPSKSIEISTTKELGRLRCGLRTSLLRRVSCKPIKDTPAHCDCPSFPMRFHKSTLLAALTFVTLAAAAPLETRNCCSVNCPPSGAVLTFIHLS